MCSGYLDVVYGFIRMNGVFSKLRRSPSASQWYLDRYQWVSLLPENGHNLLHFRAWLSLTSSSVINIFNKAKLERDMPREEIIYVLSEAKLLVK